VPIPEVPAVLLGEASLKCNIDWKTNGVQQLKITKGSGIEFDAQVSPILDGTVNFTKPSAQYQFTSHLAKAGTATLSGVGPVELERLDTKVSVEVSHFDQPDGPGSSFSFTSADIVSRGVYVEFAGIAKAHDGSRYAFRINLGPTTGGSGKVSPADANIRTKLKQKEVSVDAPVTAVVRTIK
jgi:hypothetical protein